MLKANRASVFAVLGDPVRLELLARIGDGGSITELATDLPITRQAIRDVQVSMTNHGRFVSVVVYLFIALVVGLSLHIGFYGLP